MENVHIVKFVSLSVRPVSQGYRYLISCFDELSNQYVQYNYYSPSLVTWIRENQYLRIEVDGKRYESEMNGPTRWHASAITVVSHEEGDLSEEQRRTISKFQQWLMFENE